MAPTYYFLFRRDSLLLDASGSVPLCPAPPFADLCLEDMQELPPLEGHPCYAAALTDRQADALPEDWTLQSLRESFYHLRTPLYRMAGKARELLHWDSQTRYCALCGTPLERHTVISKRCPHCGKEVWPALATAIIVAVTRNEGREILLVQSNKFKRDYMGLVAGFVETGETLEEAVAREVMEETGVTIRNLRYVASQPWPYPCGLMVGYEAEWAGGEIRLQRSELNKGGWFSRDDLPAIPGRVSLARHLIDRWLKAGG